jgi:signal transduction histidine kinase
MTAEIIKQFSAFPTKILAEAALPSDGILVKTSNYCRKKYIEGTSCSDFYSRLKDQPDGYYRCPFGFTAYKTSVIGVPVAITSIIPLPRDSASRNAAEDQRLRDHPVSGVTRESVEKMVRALESMKHIYGELEKQALRTLPHALHEIRKLNGAIKAESEALTADTGDSRCLTIFRASEFMSTQFELLDLLINESIARLPVKEKGQLDALVHKCVKIFETKAEQKRIKIDYFTRHTVWVNCCDKTLPIIITILIDNAIRYSPEQSVVTICVKKNGEKAILTVQNPGEMKLSPERRFVKNERGVSDIEGSGFGLYFAKNIAEQHGGSLTCDTDKNRVLFTFELPARK